jgi:hypothetical protein
LPPSSPRRRHDLSNDECSADREDEDRDDDRRHNPDCSPSDGDHQISVIVGTTDVVSAQMFTWNAGVMIRYLVEVDLGVRHSSTDKVDWYLEPGVRLALLHLKFASLLSELEENSEERTRAKELATGAAAGVLLVAASLVTARRRHDGVPGLWEEKDRGASHEVPCAIVRAAGVR